MLEKYGIVYGSKEQLKSIKKEAIIGKKESSYGTELIVKREAVPQGFSISPVSIEELFVFMAKENK